MTPERSCWNCKYNSRKFTDKYYLDKFYCYRHGTVLRAITLTPCEWWEYGAIGERRELTEGE